MNVIKFRHRTLIVRRYPPKLIKLYRYRDCVIEVFDNGYNHLKYEYKLTFDKILKTLKPKRYKAVRLYDKNLLTVHDRTSHYSLNYCKESAETYVNEILYFTSSPRLRMENW
jgi:hypothetical protein